MCRAGRWGFGPVALRSCAVFHRKLADVMTFAGAEESDQSGDDCESNLTGKNTHNASQSMRPVESGARRKAGGSGRPACVNSPGGGEGLPCYRAESGGAPPHSITQATIWCVIGRPRFGVRCSAVIIPSALQSSRPQDVGRPALQRGCVPPWLIAQQMKLKGLTVAL